jgi:hypothetical protein
MGFLTAWRSIIRFNPPIQIAAFCFCSLTAIVLPTSAEQTFFSCTDYHCDIGRTVTLSTEQWQGVRALFHNNNSPEEERGNIRRAIALLEDTVGQITGTWRDLAGNFAGAGQPGQLDCISESKNTTTYLQLLAADGLLKWHGVGQPRVRSPLSFNTHWTAVIVDQSNGKQFAVDS